MLCYVMPLALRARRRLQRYGGDMMPLRPGGLRVSSLELPEGFLRLDFAAIFYDYYAGATR